MMAAVVGELEAATIENFGGYNVEIWAEPNQIGLASTLFSNLQSMLNLVEV